MSIIEEKVVKMVFDNSSFEKNIKTSVNSLNKFKNSLNMSSAQRSLGSLKDTVRSFNLNSLANAAEGAGQKFSAMSTIAIGALIRIGEKAVDVGAKVIKALTIDPVLTGFNEYELKMNSVQTIMNGTGESLDVVMEKLNELNKYADDTIYSFSDMTTNIGKFTNAGVDLETAVEAIKGISNEAAVSGANAVEASRAMYNIAQALSVGSVKLIDWKSIENANMATMGFKQTLIDTAKELGVLQKAQIGGNLNWDEVTAQNFRASIEGVQGDTWITTEVLLESLKKYSDETTEFGKKAYAAAQDIKTFTQMFDVLKEAAQSGWAESAEYIIGDFEEAKSLWTAVGNEIGGILDSQAKERNQVIRTWAEFGGRSAAIEGIAEGWRVVKEAVTAVSDAFTQYFFPNIASGENTVTSIGLKLIDATRSFRDFFKNMHMTSVGTKQLQLTFKGLFSVFDVFKDSLQVLIIPIKRIFENLNKLGSTGASLGLLLMHISEVIKESGIFVTIGNKLADVVDILFNNFTKLSVPLLNAVKNMNPIEAILHSIGVAIKFVINTVLDLIESFTGLDLTTVRKGIEDFGKTISDKFSGIKNKISGLKLAFDGFGFKITDVFKKSTKDMEGYSLKDSKILDTLSGAFSSAKTKINSFLFSDENKETIFDKIFNSFKKEPKFSFIDKIKGALEELKSFVGPILEGVKIKFEDFKKKLKEQFSLGDFRFIHNTFNTLFGAGILTGLGIFVKNLFTAFKGISNAVTNVNKDIKTFKKGILNFFPGLNKSADKVATSLSKGFTSSFDALKDTLKAYQTQLKANVLKEIAISIAILAGSVLVMSLINPSRLTGVMFALTTMVTELVGAMKVMDSSNLFTGKFTSDPSKTMIKLASAVFIFSLALKSLSKCDPVKLAASVGALSVILWELVGVISVLNKVDPKNITKGVTALIPMGIALNIVASAVKKLGKLPFDQLLKGVGAVSALMMLMVGFIAISDKLMTLEKSSKGISKVCKAMIALSVAILILSASVKILGNMPLQDLVEGVSAIGVLLLAIGGFVALLSKFDTTSIGKVGLGLVIFAAGISILTKNVKDLGGMKIENLAAGLGSLIVMLIAIFAFVGLMETVKTSKILVAANALLVIGAGVKFIASAISKIAKSGDIPTIVASMGALIGVMTAFTLLSKLSDPKKLGALGMALLTMGPVFSSIGKALAKIASVGDIGSIIASMVAMAGVLGAIGVVAQTVDSNKLMKTGMAMLLIGPGLKAIADSISTLSGLGLEQILAPLLGIGGVLLELGLFSEVIDPGKLVAAGAGLLVMGLALKAIAGVLVTLGNMSLAQIGTALLAIAGSFLVFGAVAAILTPVVGVMISLAAAMLILSASFAIMGVSILAVGAGFMLLANAISIVAAYGEGTIASFVDNMSQFLIYLVQLISETIVTILETIVNNTTLIIQTIITLIDALLQAVMIELPKIVMVVGMILTSILAFIITFAPKIAEAVLIIITEILNVIAENLPNIIQAGVDIIVALIEGIGLAGVQIYDAAFNTIITFINGITETITTRTPELVEAFKALFRACFTAILTIITGNNIEFLSKGRELMTNLKTGIEGVRESVLNFFGNLIRDAIAKIKGAYEDFKSSGRHIVNGLRDGISEAKQTALDKLTELGNGMKDAFNRAVQINSPSKVFFESGMYICLGLANGIKEYSSQAINEVGNLGREVVNESTSMIGRAVDILNDMDSLNPVITPTLDLSNVVSGAKQINSMFNASRAIGVSSDDQNGTNNTSGLGGTTFIQNNYSPKALSRIEIYRDTRNLFSQAKGALS